MINLKSNKFKLILLFLFVLFLSVFFDGKHAGIFDYNPKSDREFILNTFKNNWYWLVSESSKDFSAEFMLDNKSSSKDKVGDLNIKVCYEKNKPVGFTAYFMKTSNYGYILFIAVAEQYRGHGYSKKLINYALEDLKKKGACIVALTTRTSNKVARALYISLGFKEFENDGKFVKYKKSIN